MIKKYGNKRPVLILDNVSYHKSATTKAVLRKLKLQAIYNISYRPERNPIEMYFGHLKSHIRKLRLQKLSDGAQYNSQQLVR